MAKTLSTLKGCIFQTNGASNPRLITIKLKAQSNLAPIWWLYLDSLRSSTILKMMLITEKWQKTLFFSFESHLLWEPSSFNEKRLDTRPISSRLRVGRGSNGKGQGQYVAGRGLWCGWAREVMPRNLYISHHSKFRITKQPTYQPGDTPSL